MVMDALYQWMFNQIHINGITLDVDSAVMIRYGTQEGAARGYNSAKRGRASHHRTSAESAAAKSAGRCTRVVAAVR